MKKNTHTYIKRAAALTLTISLLFTTACSRGGGNTGGTTGAGDPKFDEFLEELFIEEMEDNTLNLHFTLKDPSLYGLEDMEPTLGDLDDRDFANMEEDFDDVKETVQELESFDYDDLSEKQQLTYTILHRYLEKELSMEGCAYQSTAFGIVTGVESNMPLNMSLYEFYSTKDVEDYLALMEQLDDFFEYCTDYEEYRTDQGYGMSDVMIDDAIEQCETFLEHTTDNYLITTFDNKIDAMDLTDSEKEAYKERNRNSVLNTVIPSYEKMIDDLNALRGRSEDLGGICNYEGGKQYYEYILSYKTGSSKTPKEMEKLLLDVMDDASTMLYDVYANAPDVYMEYYGDENFQVVGLSEPTEYLEYYKSQMQGSFPTPPAVNYTISDIDPSIADMLSPAFCVTPCIDDYTNGVIQVNRSENNHSLGNISATYAHEGYPGHLYQMTYYLSQDPYPIRNCLNFLGYDEGWAEYIELRSYNLVDYQNYDSQYVREIYIANDLVEMALCCLVDIYVNYYGYSVEDITDFMNDNGFNGDTAEDLYYMIVEEPGYYPQYFVGYLEFCELRDYTKDKLGSDFNELEFHKVILDAGPCDFTTLHEQMDKYIDEKTATN